MNKKMIVICHQFSLCDVTNNRFFFLVPCSAIMKKARREFAKSASIKKPKTKYAPKHKKNLNQCF